MAKDRLAPISFFEQFPDYLRLHKQVIQDVAAIRGAVRSEVGVIDQIGNTVLSFARRVGSVEPFKGNWRVYAEHTELQHAELTGQPTPFTTWDELVNEYHKDWRRSGLTDPTVFPVAQQILTHTGLWNDNSVRALVLDNLVDRCEVDFFGMENVRQHFVAQVSQGTMSTVEEAQDFLAHIADHVSEMGTKRAIGNIRHFTPKRKMSTEEWEAFLRTEEGIKLGLYSTAEWWLSMSSKPSSSPRIDLFRRIKAEALSGYMEDAQYRQFADNPDIVIYSALKSFKPDFNP